MSSSPTNNLANPRRVRSRPTGARPAVVDGSSIEAQMIGYFAARGRDLPTSSTGMKVQEEALELVEALAEDDELHAQHELADVVIAAAAVAHRRGWTVEECIRLKTIKDTGREALKHNRV